MKSTTSITKKSITIKKTVTGKSFRLLDFHPYDDKLNICNNEDDNDAEDNDNANDVENTGNKKTPPLQFIIQMYGLNESGETCCIFIKDYTPFFYVKIPQQWDESNVQTLFREIRNKIEYHNQKYVLSAELVQCNKLYGFTAGEKSKFVKLTFSNMMTFNRVKNLWYYLPKGQSERKLKPLISQNAILQLYESKIPPILRYFHINNISPSGWVFIPTHKMNTPTETTTTCKYEYICDCADLIPQPKKETRTPYKICSFDIEASSSHGDFPVPIKTYKRLATNIMDVFIKQSALSTLKPEMTHMLIKKGILSAFGYGGVYNGIDIVYPKITPNKPDLEGLINVILSISLDEIENGGDGGNMADDAVARKKKLLTIETMFDKINSRVADADCGVGGEEGEDGEGDEGEAEEKEDTNTDEEATGGDVGKEEYVQHTKLIKRPKRPAATAKTQTRPAPSSALPARTIKDIFLDSNLSRDEKICKINEVFVHILPELEGDKVTFIGSTFVRYGETDPYLNHCVVLNTCDPVPNAVIETVSTETELLLKWTEIIQRENPDIIIGYNIFGFDYEFMFRRSQENDCERQFLTLSRKNGEISGNYNRNTQEYSLDNTKIVLATGEYDLKYPRMSGRLQIDLYAYFRRDFNLSSYKLDDVAGEFIGDTITNIEFDVENGCTHLHTDNILGLRRGDFIHIELSVFTTDYFKDGMKFPVVDIQMSENGSNIIVIGGIERELVTGVESGKNIKWCMAKDDVTPQDIFRLTNGTSADRAIVAKYCIQDCNLVHHLFNKLDVLTGYIEMSRICSVPISYLVLRGQGIKLTSFVAKKCREKNTLMPDIEKKGTTEGYEGAIVLPPKCAMYMDNPVACVDYSSLYPSSMISQNYCPSSKVWTREYDLDGNLLRETGERNAAGIYIYDNLVKYQYIDIEFDTYEWRRKPDSKPTSKAVKTKVGRKICRWAQLPDGQKSILPSILEELLKARKETRNQIKTEKDVFMQNILDKRQLGYKVTANSLYGQCGSKTSTFYEQDVAASTTATGRMMITYAKRIIEEVYGDMIYVTKSHGAVQCNAEYVYGDTDSVFFTFNLKNIHPADNSKATEAIAITGKKALEITIEIAQDVADLCTQFLKPPMELSYEKTLYPFCLLSKKRYFGKLFEYNPDKGKLKFMGLSLKRRDNCDLLKDVYGHILNILLLPEISLCDKIKQCMLFIDDCLDQLIRGTVSMDKLAITKSLSGYYKNPAQIAHAVLAERIGNREAGNKPKPGDRIKYVHIVSNNKKALQGEKIETPEFIRSRGVKIDYTFYITNQLMKPLQQLFGLALEEILKISGNRSSVALFKKDMEEIKKHYGKDLEILAKQNEKYCSKKVEKLLFEKYLIKIKNQREGVQQIDSFFLSR